jgi:hypothetical protein
VKLFLVNLVLGSLLVAAPVLAQRGGPTHLRISSANMTCAQVKTAVRNHGAVIIYSSQHIYDRFVAHRGYCAFDQILRSKAVRSADKVRCYAGYVCRQYDRDDYFRP